MPSYAQHFQQAFNQALGVPMGRPTAIPTVRVPSYKESMPTGKEVARNIAQGVVELPTDVENAYQDTFGEASVGGGRADFGKVMHDIAKGVEKTQRRIEHEYAGKVKQATKEIREGKRISYAAEQQAKHEANSGVLSNPVAKIAAQIAGKGLDYLGRPQQAIFGAMMADRTQAGKEDLDWSWDTLGDVFKGAWHGAKGEKKWTGGQIAEEYMEGAPHWAKVVGGVGSELGLDPMNYIGLGELKYLKGGRDALNLEKMGQNVAKQVGEAVAEEGIDLAVKRGGPAALKGLAHEAGVKSLEAEAKKRVQNLALDITKGGVKGRLSAGSRKGFAATIAENVANDARKVKYGRFDELVEDYRKLSHAARKAGKVVDPIALHGMGAISKHFEDFLAALPTGSFTKSSWDKAITDTANAIRSSTDKELESLAVNVANKVAKSYHSAPALRVGKKFVKIPFLGKAMEIAQHSGRIESFEGLKGLSHAGQFPGKLALLLNRGRAHGVELLDKFQKEVDVFMKQYSKADRKEVIHAIENNISLHHNPQLQKLEDFFKHHMDRMWEQEVKAGARADEAHKKLKNYTFVWNKKGNPHDLERFKKLRKADIWNGKGAAKYNTEAALKKGFSPVTDAADMLIARQIKSNRDISRALFRSDLAESYGFVARHLPEHAAESRGLAKLEHDSLSENLRNLANKEAGDQWYLPGEMNKALDQFGELSKFSSDYKPIRWLRKMTNFFKAATTVYNPGYHPRNMISDAVMGFLDGIGLKGWGNYLDPRRIRFGREGAEKVPRFHWKTGAKWKLGDNWTVTSDEAKSLFRANASGGGFAGAEYGGNMAERLVSRVNKKVRNVSETREDFGRMVHFMEALKQEYKGLARSGLSPDARKAKAVEQAAYRVNHFKFDYGALTKWEQRVMKPTVPFYTFTRKAVPALTENFLMNPKWLIRYNKLRHMRNQDTGEHFKPFEIPDWIKQTGFATIADEKEPQLLSFDPLPTDAFSSVIPPEMTAQGTAQMLLSQINPYAQVPIEQTFKKQIFSGKKVDSLPEYILDKFGGPLNAAEAFKSNWDKDVPFMENILGSRLGLGLPLHRVTQKQQDFQRNLWEDKNIEEPFDKFNEGKGKESGVKVYVSYGDTPKDMSSYKVKDENTGKVLWQGIDPFKALEVANRKTSAIDTNLDDWNDSKGAKSHIRVYYSERQDPKHPNNDNRKVTSYRVKNTRNDKVLKDFKNPQAALDWARERANS